MKLLTIRLPENLMADIENESRLRKISKSDVVRERLELNAMGSHQPPSLKAISDLIGSVDGLPADMSTRKKAYLKAMDYGKKRHR
jgi:hypothetical protein